MTASGTRKRPRPSRVAHRDRKAGHPTLKGLRQALRTAVRQDGASDRQAKAAAKRQRKAAKRAAAVQP